ncbi:protein of unknown function; putative exported protein [Methylorubrum extorquens DM4]|uniref:Uncharacterized protein n=1 Tax=Methylorubrum extorquens (strain DSM 6343 / CIP 106787 / DM4) TaxID=661410 RepID=C7CER2_METED|nr:protein of unknown function; putative exported protein [Methylorubrum extorquens DM4]
MNLHFFTALLLPSGAHTTGKLALTPDQSDGGTSATAPGDRPHASTEITIGPIATFERETPEEVVRAPCVERRPPPQ